MTITARWWLSKANEVKLPESGIFRPEAGYWLRWLSRGLIGGSRCANLFPFFRTIVCLLVGSIFFPIPEAVAQQAPEGRFLSDSIRIGSPVYYSLSYRHSPDEVVIFPDTNYQFAPFELLDKQFFPTRTNASGSLDSVVYRLMSFEIDPVQSLSLPVFIISEKDSTPFFAEPDTVLLKEMITVPVDTLSLKANTRFLPLRQETNYALFYLIALGLLVLFGLLFLLFGKQVRNRYRLYRLQKRHLAFLQEFRQTRGALGQSDTVLMLEKMVVLWKQYIETLSNKPYSTYTTKEISDRIPDKALTEALKHIDRTVYGGLPFDKTSETFAPLQDFAVQLYEKRRKEMVEGEKKTKKLAGERQEKELVQK
jgi:hypothetical protein